MSQRYLSVLLFLLLPCWAQAQAPAAPAKPKANADGAKKATSSSQRGQEKRTLVDTLDEKVPLDVGIQLRIFKQARSRKLELERLEGNMERRRKRLKQMLTEVEERYQTMRTLQGELTSQLKASKPEDPAARKANDERRANARMEQVIKLSKVFNKMKADEAAKMIPVMDESLVVDVLARLKPKQAANVLGKLDAELAAKLTTKMAEAKNDK